MDGLKQYSPKKCCFLPKRLNQLFIEHPSESGELGIYIKVNKDGSKRYCINQSKYYTPKQPSFKSFEEAQKEYKQCIIQMLTKIINEEITKGYIPPSIIKALKRWVFKYENEVDNESKI